VENHFEGGPTEFQDIESRIDDTGTIAFFVFIVTGHIYSLTQPIYNNTVGSNHVPLIVDTRLALLL